MFNETQRSALIHAFAFSPGADIHPVSGDHMLHHHSPAILSLADGKPLMAGIHDEDVFKNSMLLGHFGKGNSVSKRELGRKKGLFMPDLTTFKNCQI
jgi:hypothetical protein